MSNFMITSFQLTSFAIVSGWRARGLLIETPLQNITLKSPRFISRFLVSANNKQAFVKTAAAKAVRSSGITYAKLRAFPPHNLSEVTRGID